ncbi:hypothetical protein Tsubulata_037762 [Turnera subulata]|uniref:Protein BIG GRAIN 1-like B n=1 Tax=Turnera subulata TaxID=218843 RepID=A0A9Q0G816_9ROSI|nr:hypothetical protein Tsubulata_037762 [Turnera subulata]
MDRWEKPLREDRYRHHRDNPSFSSTLLDAIYRSIDESNSGHHQGEEEELIFYRETMRKKQHTSSSTTSTTTNSNGRFREDAKQENMAASLQRACMIEKWMEKKVMSYDDHQVVSVRRKSTADFDHKLKTRKHFDSVLLNSSSSSSESSCGGGFSSSESESFYGGTVNSSRSSTAPSYTMQRPKPIRTSVSARPERHRGGGVGYESDMFHHLERNYAPTTTTQKPKHEGSSSFVKTKSKAMKIYGDLKKVKQPISPGGRLASFINSLFTAGNAKKAKISSPGGYEQRTSLKSHEQASSSATCSTASSFSRSCLSKTPSSRGKLSNNGAKRSVRFYPVSVIVDEDCRPCGQKSLYGGTHEESTLMAAAITTTSSRSNPAGHDQELKLHVLNESRRVEGVARELLESYRKKNDHHQDLDMTDLCNGNIDEDQCSEEEYCDDDDDVASCASSDLFELDNLSAIGIDHRYREELPVYETTHLDTNRAIANGLVV